MRFVALRLVSWVFRILGIVVAVISFLGACALLSQWGRMAFISPRIGIPIRGILGEGLLLIVGLTYALGLYGAGELIELFLAIEANTRETMELLRRLGSSAASRDVSPAPPPGRSS